MIKSLGSSYQASRLCEPMQNKKTSATQGKDAQDDKVALLTKKINDGSYKFDLDSLAKKIADELA